MRFSFPLLISILVSNRQRYPSVRSTNVYEEGSLGIYEDNTSIHEENFSASGDRITVWGSYLAMHARKQLAFGMRPFHVLVHLVHYHRLDMWWLGLALFLLCIIEVCCSPFILPLSLIIRILSVTNSRTKGMQHGLIFLTLVS
jgi:hypothetical protein